MTAFEKYIIARWCYSCGVPYITDAEYKYIEDKLKNNPSKEEKEYLDRSWSDDSCPVELLKKYGMERCCKEVELTHNSESIESINSELEFEEMFKGLAEKTRVSYKIDGFNVQLNYNNGKFVSANTRGRKGNSVSANTLCEIAPKTIPYKGKVKITAECSIPTAKWKEYKRLTGNTSQRCSVSTGLAEGDTSFLSLLAYNAQVEGGDKSIANRDVYEVIRKCGFKTPISMCANDFVQLKKIVEVLGKRNRAYGYLTDGLVVENKSTQMALRIGEWEEKELMSYVTGYEETTGIHSIAMNVLIRGVKTEDGVRTRVSVVNLKCIVENELEIGSPIVFNIRSAVSAQLNTEATKDLKMRWCGKYQEYRKHIDKIEKDKEKEDE